MELNYSIQTYQWGKKGLDSKVAKLLNSIGENIDPEEYYAELWLGTHSSGPTYITSKELGAENLGAWIKKNPNVLGDSVISLYGKLPFLLKVLSVRTALSIQMHPSKEQAVSLNKQFPSIYKDDNHKPELAIALSKFEALCGFKKLGQIKCNIKEIKELQTLIGDSLVAELLNCPEDESIHVFKNVFHAIMTADEKMVKEQLSLLYKRIKTMDESSISEELSLFSRVYNQFPGDGGCFCVFILNYVCLEIGESIYIGANEPHAYLYGDCIECMACSDNVVRAGLTPKFKDIHTLCSLLNYTFESPCAKLLIPFSENQSSQLYIPPVSDFAVAKIQIEPDQCYNIPIRSSASICLCVEGSGVLNDSKKVCPGKAFFIPANESVQISNNGDCVLELYQAFANVLQKKV